MSSDNTTPPGTGRAATRGAEPQRYRGHTALCEIDLPGQQRISSARVLIAGAGGLGSPAALYLAAAGVGHITVIDPDKVSLSNLQRQIMHRTADLGTPKALSARRAMTAINPHITVEPIEAPLDAANAAALIGSHDITLDCTDNYDTRLLVADTCTDMGKPCCYGAVSRWQGHAFTYVPGHAAYRDIFGSTPPAGGDTPCAIDGILNTVAGITGCIQATEAIKYLAGTGDLLTDRLLTFDAITMAFSTFHVTKKHSI